MSGNLYHNMADGEMVLADLSMEYALPLAGALLITEQTKQQQ